MAENESMEGKDLAKEEKQSFRERLKVQITKLKNGKTSKQNQNEEQPKDDEKDDEKPELEEEDKENQDEKKEKIAKKYNVNAKHVIHISKDEKLTENEKFQGLVEWAKDYDEVYFIPEASGKNVLQQDIETREFMDHKYNSGYDLDNKSDALDRQADLEKRGIPSEKEGVQLEEIEGNHKQNVIKNVEDIEKDLMSRDGITDKLTVPPGYYENRAKKVLAIMEADENITYEQAVEKVEEQGQREDGGRTPGEQPKDPRRG